MTNKRSGLSVRSGENKPKRVGLETPHQKGMDKEKVSSSSRGGRASASAARVAKLRAKEYASEKYKKVKKRPLTARLRESMKRVPLSLSYGARGGGGAGRK